MWTITSIDEADYGCEERMPGEPLMVLVTIEDDFGQRRSFECADNWLRTQKLDEGDEWPDDIDADDENFRKYTEMSDWMDNYFNAVEELE